MVLNPAQTTEIIQLKLAILSQAEFIRGKWPLKEKIILSLKVIVETQLRCIIKYYA